MPTLDLTQIDVEVGVDMSASMLTDDCTGGATRWSFLQETVLGVVAVAAKTHPEGIPVTVFARRFQTYNGVKDAAGVNNIFTENDPFGGTDTAGFLQNRLDAYFARQKAGGAKPLVMIVFTDGRPDNEEALEKLIANSSKQLGGDRTKLGISFIQIGGDKGATQYLETLNDGLTAKYPGALDIVNCQTALAVENLGVKELVNLAFTQ